MKINIVTEGSPGWVLRMMAENWRMNLPNCTLTERKPCLDSDVNFYVNWKLFREKTCSLDVGWFTHREDEEFDEKSHQVDFCICPSEKTLELLPMGKSAIVRHGVGQEYIGKKDVIVFGIVGRNYESNRKRFDVADILKDIPNSRFEITGGTLDKEEVVSFYQKIDYLLVTSENEGGPVPVLEALTLGKPVIAPNVGWCWEYPVIRYDTYDELFRLIMQLCSFVDVGSVWKESSQSLLEIFRSL